MAIAIPGNERVNFTVHREKLYGYSRVFKIQEMNMMNITSTG